MRSSFGKSAVYFGKCGGHGYGNILGGTAFAAGERDRGAILDLGGCGLSPLHTCGSKASVQTVPANRKVSKANLTILANMTFPPIILFICYRCLLHTAFLHYTKTRRVFGKVTGSNFPKSHFTQFRNDRMYGLRCIAVSLILRMNHISDFYFIILDSAVIDKTDQFFVQVYAVLQMLRVVGPAENDQFSHQFFRTTSGFRFR